MTRRLSIEWPDAAPFKGRGREPIRLLAVSDQFDPALSDARSRRALEPIDLIVGCGDLDCDELTFLADGFDVPIAYVLGNHDTDTRWADCEHYCPAAMPSSRVTRECGLAVAGLGWPGKRGKRSSRNELLAWRQALVLALRRLGRSEPLIVITHAPPRGAGDMEDGEFHRGFAGYSWLLRRLKPRLWLHGHTPIAAVDDWQVTRETTTVVNVTGAVLIEIHPPGSGVPGPG